MRQPGAKGVDGGVWVLKAAQGEIPLDYEHQQQWLEGPFNNVLKFDDAARVAMGSPDIGLPIVRDDLERGISRGGMGGLQNGMAGLHSDLGGF